MKTQLTPHLVDLIFEAALKSFWRKAALSKFLQQSEIAGLPSWLPNESKREYLTRTFELLRRTDRGKGKILQLAQFLAEQTAFPDLMGWEDTKDKLDEATRAVASLHRYLNRQEEALSDERQRRESRRRMQEVQERARASQQSLQSLSNKLAELANRLGKAEAGHEFEDWFYDLMQYSEITARRRYKTEGREIDGSITIGDTTYLLECKFTREQVGVKEIDIFRGKVESKADNTMGLFVSMSGYSSVAIKSAGGKKTPLLLLDHGHIYRVLLGTSSFADVVQRVRRHCSQTGNSYLQAGDFDS